MTDGRVAAVSGYAMHAQNAADMWTALAERYGEVLVRSDSVRIVAPSPFHTLRAIVLDPALSPERTSDEVAQTLLSRADADRRLAEDPSGRLDLAGHGFGPRFRMPVMVLEPGAAIRRTGEVGTGPFAVTVAEDSDTLAVAERVVTAVYPPGRTGPDMRGRSLPVGVLGIPGWRVWLGSRDGVPATAAYTYHDGTSVGVYQVGTLPEHRGHGVARALMDAVLDAYPDVPISLTSTDQGRPMYLKLGFRVANEAVWWTPVHTGDDRGPPLR
jgi:GNAT superfamily N-acetyltransferase